MARAIWNDVVVAESEDVVTVDGFTYFPEAAVKPDLLRPSAHTSVCSWKGLATYWDVVVGESVNANAAWTYRDPKLEAEHVRGRIAFWKGVRIER